MSRAADVGTARGRAGDRPRKRCWSPEGARIRPWSRSLVPRARRRRRPCRRRRTGDQASDRESTGRARPRPPARHRRRPRTRHPRSQPTGHGVVRLPGRLVLGGLDVDRHTREAWVVAAVVEVQVPVHDQPHLADVVAVRGERDVDGALLHLVHVVDERIAGADAGLEQQQPGRVSQRERQHRSRPAVQRVPVRKGHVGEVQRHHVFDGQDHRCDSTTRRWSLPESTGQISMAYPSGSVTYA